MNKEVNFSDANLESLAESHVYVPDTVNDYRSFHTGKSIKTISNPNRILKTKVVNKVNLPPFCTATGNPGKGSYLTISYQAKDKLLEVFTFEKYINSFIGHPIVRDVEFLAQEIATEVAIALNVPVTLEAQFCLVGFQYGQSVEVEVQIEEHLLETLRSQYKDKYLAFLDKKAKGEIVVKEDKKTFLQRVEEQNTPEVVAGQTKENSASQCPVKHQITGNTNQVEPKAEQAKQSVEVANEQADDYEVCPFVTREEATPGSKCPVTGKSYE
ncbi:hypothetical protein CKF54_06055 [Psittacicella hinzii]|uniref:Uncharacterized protein n=1 Tax=Psittacicella hinzii TaxID=2028575 RepID=A0A3A1Y0E8_9GAMM|nr:hypothetical protein [Psittacicella hinzii]RIY31802.1 hypothetical protein CKF54_06055 [Psittacicella hinzii]